MPALLRPPGPRGRAVSGNTQAFEEDRLAFLMRSREAHGDVVSLGRLTTAIHDPDLAHDVLRSAAFTVGEDFLGRPIRRPKTPKNTADTGRTEHAGTTEPVGHDGHDGHDEVAVLRRRLAPALRRTQVGFAAHTAAELTQGSITAFSQVPCDPVEVFERVVGQTTAQFFFGADDTARFTAATDALFGALSRQIGNPWALPAWAPTRTRRQIRCAHQHLRDLLTDHLRNHPEGAARGPAQSTARALWENVCSRPGTGRSAPSLDAAADVLISALLAGYRVPAAQASWLLMILADYPELQDRLANEAAVFTSPSAFSFDATDYPVAVQVVREALRLYPSTWLIRRTCTQPTSIADYPISPGHQIWISPYVLGRDPRIFPDPETVRPERWHNAPSSTSAHLPFGGGPRGCPGAHLTLAMLVSIALTTVAAGRVYRLPGPITLDARINLAPQGLSIGIAPLTETAPATGGQPSQAQNNAPVRPSRVTCEPSQHH